MNTLQKISIGFIAVGIALAVGGFFVPPYGVIDGSIISFFGELLAATGLFMAWDTIKAAIEKGTDAKVKVGNTEIEIDSPDESNEN